ncbi:MAG: SGNH/GDSL hydrolase family protein [Clostridia bacterium]|nr:SGNH/GDSL hydrolase family protein [Clostridia bacterium]
MNENTSKSYFDNEYGQLKKNTVNAKGQLTDSKSVRFFGADNKGVRIMFVGNSITLHGVLKEIGWNNEWGMAASDAEHDYVHILMKKTKDKQPDAAFCICQVAQWETDYKNGKEKYPLYEKARAFGADVIIMRFVENCPGKDFDGEVFKREMKRLLDYLDKENKAKMILTTGFWHHPGDHFICEFGKENKYPVVLLGDLGEDDSMTAKGLFEHSGVAMHPGNLGMQTIAERIFAVLKEIIR